MHLYLFNAVTILFYGFIIGLFNNKRNKVIIAAIAFVQLLVIMVLRKDTVGADVRTYYQYFLLISNLKFPAFEFVNMESGYVFFNSLISFFTINKQLFIVIISAVILTGYFLFLYKNSEDITLSIFLFITLEFYSLSFSMVRQSIAIIIILFSYEFIKKRKPLKFVLCVLLATLFHKTAIIFIVFYVVTKIKISYKYISFVLLGSLVVFMLGGSLINYLVHKFYPYYSELVVSGEGVTMLILLTGILLGMLPLHKELITKNSVNSMLFHALIVAVVLQIMSIQFSLFNRMTLYFTIFLTILIPSYIKMIEDSRIRLLVKIGVVSLSLIQLGLALKNNLLSIVPYFFYWQ
ncbi:EpsG family protein [Paenibacillus methanolicus]|uniref:EpsG-like putative glucosyltransferase n=1 Tax=Paenibacillus methanolicus TaxID=582686 RepID=A0A5S5CBE2_9BACL|nr:EpsG family protein [Paenibacillus methanolicus]TYP75666.1 EpsG-like putative glucosyltransferase [Paenibacillus methanolicus]